MLPAEQGNQVNELLISFLVVLYLAVSVWILITIINQDWRDKKYMAYLSQAELDRQTIETLVESVLDNPRLARAIVKAWLDRHNLKLAETQPDYDTSDTEGSES